MDKRFSVLPFAFFLSAFVSSFRLAPMKKTKVDQEDAASNRNELWDWDDMEQSIQSHDARLPEFAMPAFNSLARVRETQLKQRGLWGTVATEASKAWRTGSRTDGFWGSKGGSAEAGIVQATYDTLKLSTKLPVFEKYAHKNGRQPRDGKMDFDEFSVMLTHLKGDEATFDQPVVPDGLPETKLRDKAAVRQWLKSHFGYGNSYTEQIADWFIKKPRKAEDVYDMVCFATLDKDKDAVLKIVEAQPYLPVDLQDKVPDGPWTWSETARVENTDFASLGFPAHLTNNVLTMSDSGAAFAKSEWDALQLPDKLTDFVERSKRPVYADYPAESLKEQLRFYQIAQAFPSTKDHTQRKFTQPIKGEEVVIDIPTIEDVAGQKKRLELEQEDIKRWLKHVKGMKNSYWLKWTGKFQYATDMARDVLRWGNGSIPGDDPNFRLRGHMAGDMGDEWTDVAPRMALFVELDEDGDGLLDFSVVHPYLNKAMESLFDKKRFYGGSSSVSGELPRLQSSHIPDSNSHGQISLQSLDSLHDLSSQHHIIMEDSRSDLQSSQLGSSVHSRDMSESLNSIQHKSMPNLHNNVHRDSGNKKAKSLNF